MSRDTRSFCCMTKKLSDISDEEKKLFRDAVAHVKPHNKFDAPETTQKIYKPVQIKLQKDFVEKKSTFFRSEKKLFRDAVAHVKPHNKFDAPETTQKIYKPVQIKLQKDFVEKKSTFF